MKARSSQSSTSPKQNRLPWHRRWLVKVWRSYGGGLYAVGYAVTFLYLEARTLVTEIAASDGVLDFLSGQLLQFLLRFSTDSIMNMVHAFTWFIPLLSWHAPLGIIVLAVGFYVFDIWLREPVSRWLLGEQHSEDTPPAPG